MPPWAKGEVEKAGWKPLPAPFLFLRRQAKAMPPIPNAPTSQQAETLRWTCVWENCKQKAL